MLGEVAAIAEALPNDRVALQWDVCQEVIAWEGRYEPGPVDFPEGEERLDQSDSRNRTTEHPEHRPAPDLIPGRQLTKPLMDRPLAHLR
jgi:hypothetical protein